MGSETIVEFASAAREFCTWADGEPEDEPVVSVVIKALTLLSTVYARVFSLPDGPLGDELPAPVRNPSESRPRWAALPFDTYREVLVPHLPETMTRVEVRSLVTDLDAVYASLLAGLQHHDSGEVETAVSLWVFTAEYTWGDHAVSAMRALQLFVE